MDDMMKQVLGGWFRTGVAAVSGAMGWEQYLNGDITNAVVGLGVAVAMGVWSYFQKKGTVKA